MVGIVMEGKIFWLLLFSFVLGLGWDWIGLRRMGLCGKMSRMDSLPWREQIHVL